MKKNTNACIGRGYQSWQREMWPPETFSLFERFALKFGIGPGRLILPARPTPSLLRELEAEDTTDLCDICGFDTEPDNLIVYCESCNMGVHQTCYGIPKVRCVQLKHCAKADRGSRRGG